MAYIQETYFESDVATDFKLSPNDGFTIHFWTKFVASNANDSGRCYALFSGDGGTNSIQVDWSVPLKRLIIWVNLYDFVNSTSVNEIISVTCSAEDSPQDTSWYHIAVTADPTDRKIRTYLDGVLKSTSAAFAEDAYVGWWGDASKLYIARYESDGSLHDMWIYFDEIEILNGFCKWTEAFDVPTSAPVGVLEYVF